MEIFEMHLRQGNMADNTIAAYKYAVNDFNGRYKELNKKNLLLYKTYLIENFKPKTVNQRIQAINKYLDYMDKPHLRLKSVKAQQKSFLENVISNADYIDIYTKGGKVRRLFIPKTLRKEALEWLKTSGRCSGYLFLNRFGERITTRGIAQQLKYYAAKYKMNPDVVYPHSFRHRYAKNFLEQYNDIALLADLMGHESIETTRIYLRRTASEQQDIVDRVVVW